MGFLDNLLKREARKIVSGVLDEVVDTVTDNIKDSIRENRDGSYWCKRTRLAKEACGRQNVGYVHFITRLPNRTGYIREQLKKIVNK